MDCDREVKAGHPLAKQFGVQGSRFKVYGDQESADISTPDTWVRFLGRLLVSACNIVSHCE